MLKLQRRLFALWMLIGLAISAGAAVLGDAGPRASLLTAEDMHRISIGADYLLMSRDVEVGGAVQKLEFQAYGGELGVDVCPWLTAFLGAGSDVGRCGEEAVWGDNKMAWFAGLHADLWKYNLADPDFLSGLLSFAGEAQFSQYRSKFAGQELSGDEWFAAFTAGYEFFVDRQQDLDNVPYSVRLTLGPAVSSLNGQALGENYDAMDTLGFVAGCELFISHNLAAGFHYLFISDGSVSASLRYHF